MTNPTDHQTRVERTLNDVKNDPQPGDRIYQPNAKLWLTVTKRDGDRVSWKENGRCPTNTRTNSWSIKFWAQTVCAGARLVTDDE